MDNVTRSSKSVTYTILDGIMSVATLLISIAIFEHFLNGEFSPYMFIILFFALACVRVIQASLNQDKKKKGVFRLLSGGGIYFVTAIVLIIWGIDNDNCILIIWLYMLDILVGRVFSVIQGKRLFGRICNGLIAAALIYLGIDMISFPEDERGNLMLILLLVIVIRALLHIIALSFSQIQLDVLMKIIRRTYALEILFGLVMLIATFSYVLPFLEDSIHNYWDGLWYCFAIVTTIGFGDITASSIVGRGLSVILGIYGIIVVSMVTSIIINFYSEVKNIQDQEREKEHEQRKKKKKKKKKASDEDTDEDAEDEEEGTEEETEEETEDADDDTEE